MPSDAKEVQDTAVTTQNPTSTPSNPPPPATTSPDIASNQPARPRRSARFATQNPSSSLARSDSKTDVEESLPLSQPVAADKEASSILGKAVAASEELQSKVEQQSQTESGPSKNTISGRLRDRKRKEPEPDDKLAQELPAKRSRRPRQLGPPLPLSEQAETQSGSSAGARSAGPPSTKSRKTTQKSRKPELSSASVRARLLGKLKVPGVTDSDVDGHSLDGEPLPAPEEGEEEVADEEDDEDDADGPSSSRVKGSKIRKPPAPKPKKKQLPDDVWTAYKASLPMLHHRTQTRMPELYEKYRSFWISKSIYAPVKKSTTAKKGNPGPSAAPKSPKDNTPLFFFWDPLSLVPNIQCQQPGCTRLLTRDGFAPWPRKVRSEQQGNDFTFWLVGARYRCNNCTAVKPKTNKAPYTSYLGWDERLLKAIPGDLRQAFPCEERGKLFFSNKGVTPEEHRHEQLFDRIQAHPGSVGEPASSKIRAQTKVKKTGSISKDAAKPVPVKPKARRGRPPKGGSSRKPWEAPTPPESSNEEEDEDVEMEGGEEPAPFEDQDEMEVASVGEDVEDSGSEDEIPVSSSTASAEAHSSATADSRTRGGPSIAGSSITAAAPPAPRPPAMLAKPYQSFQPAYSDWRTSSLRSTTGEEQRPPPSPTYPYPYPHSTGTDPGWYPHHGTAPGATPTTPTANHAAPPPHWATSYPPPPPAASPGVPQPAWAPPHQNVAAAFDPSPAARAAAIASLASQMSYHASYSYPPPNSYYPPPVASNAAPPDAQPFQAAPSAAPYASEAAVAASNSPSA
ncbi:hypothetical protein FRC04_003862 [Tulasnella sp. 424]|nr:hypothetical protein FRC04_003862 [Tulasnella sp. 424]